MCEGSWLFIAYTHIHLQTLIHTTIGTWILLYMQTGSRQNNTDTHTNESAAVISSSLSSSSQPSSSTCHMNDNTLCKRMTLPSWDMCVSVDRVQTMKENQYSMFNIKRMPYKSDEIYLYLYFSTYKSSPIVNC